MNQKLIKRDILPVLLGHIKQPYHLILIGARQTGKTSLLRLLEQKIKQQDPALPILFLNAENENDLLNLADFSDFRNYLALRNIKNGASAMVFIDEFQKMPHPTKLLKLVYDELPEIKIVATGSSSLEIYDRLSEESLVGRKRIVHIFPLSFAEFLRFSRPDMFKIWGTACQKSIFYPLDKDIFFAWGKMAIWGGYPYSALSTQEIQKREALEEIYQAYLRKDITGILRKDEKILFIKLVRLLSSQHGQLLNVNEITNTLSVSRSVIERFLFILKETFIIFLLPPYFTNKRKEITKMPKIYFIDAGLRDFIQNNFAPLNERPDSGALAEGFVLSELLKLRDVRHQLFFWRTPQGAEVDFIIKRDQYLFPIEVKYQTFKKPIVPSGVKAFVNHYRPKRAFVLTRDFAAKVEYNNTAVHFLPILFTAKIFSLIK